MFVFFSSLAQVQEARWIESGRRARFVGETLSLATRSSNVARGARRDVTLLHATLLFAAAEIDVNDVDAQATALERREVDRASALNGGAV